MVRANDRLGHDIEPDPPTAVAPAAIRHFHHTRQLHSRQEPIHRPTRHTPAQREILPRCLEHPPLVLLDPPSADNPQIAQRRQLPQRSGNAPERPTNTTRNTLERRPQGRTQRGVHAAGDAVHVYSSPSTTKPIMSSSQSSTVIPSAAARALMVDQRSALKESTTR